MSRPATRRGKAGALDQHPPKGGAERMRCKPANRNLRLAPSRQSRIPFVRWGRDSHLRPAHTRPLILELTEQISVAVVFLLCEVGFPASVIMSFKMC
jgi:hypothetical protein